jgi:serine/threonine protein kinase
MSTGNSARRLGKYELHAILGRGGMAEVWKAWDNQLGRYVAIKILHMNLQNDPDFMKRFIREARAIASLHHPNIIKIHDFQIATYPESERDIAYMVMDCVEGETLADYIRNTSHIGNVPPATTILSLFTSMSKAIDYAHQRGMVHRDIKPANILLDKRLSKDYPVTPNLMGEPILTDFGVVKLLGASATTLSGSWLGTPLYISPEQAQGKSGNELSDIYSLGVILYEICTGVRPFSGDTTLAIIMQHITATPTSPDMINPNISPDLSNVILRSLAKDPLARFPSASAMAEALAQALHISPSVNLYSLPPLADSASGLTYKSSLLLNLPSSATSSSSSSTVLPTSQTLRNSLISRYAPTDTIRLGDNVATHNLASSLNSRNRSPINHTFESSQLTSSAHHKTGRRRRAVFIGLVALLIIILIGSVSRALYVSSHQDSLIITNQVVGHALFVSTGQLNESTTQGLNNELQLNLSHIPDLPAGKSYYAWLLSDNNKTPLTSMLLGRLTVHSGIVNFFYTGHLQHSNLLATYSRLLITVEETKNVAGHLSTDKNTWRYYAELPQTPTATAQSGALDNLRFLLSGDPLLKDKGILGGLNSVLYESMQQVVKCADNISNSRNSAVIRGLLICILDYLDGVPYVQNDVPPGTPVRADPTLSQVPIIDTAKSQLNSSYLTLTSNQLYNLTLTYPPGDKQEINLANQINAELSNHVQAQLDQARQDAIQLVNMSNTQLLQPSSRSILNNMQTQVNYAFYGGNINQEGISQLFLDMQHLATFDISSYKNVNRSGE